MGVEELKVSRTGPRAVATMPAEIDAMNADEIRDALLSAAGNGVTTLIIDMSATTFCDSSGVHAVISAYRQAAAAGIEVRLVITTVRRVFRLIGADQVMPTFASLAAALA
ncbi:MAG TPA: STAS domain-containing protein [Streptosporangiaceae bacterium]|nr:STAS domain-containing protein [Streptosporangiaceae bacterium]